ncbi:MAG: GNAT family N-acetyltransferase [Candidatus Paceibacteria bacterium]
MMEKHKLLTKGIRFSIQREGKEVAHAYLYLLINDLHSTPFGLLEDVYVDSACRGAGAGNELLAAVMQGMKGAINSSRQAEMTGRDSRYMTGISDSDSANTGRSSASTSDGASFQTIRTADRFLYALDIFHFPFLLRYGMVDIYGTRRECYQFRGGFLRIRAQ